MAQLNDHRLFIADLTVHLIQNSAGVDPAPSSGIHCRKIRLMQESNPNGKGMLIDTRAGVSPAAWRLRPAPPI